MSQDQAEKSKRLVRIQKQPEPVKIPKEYTKKVKEVLPENIEPENIEGEKE